MSSRGPDERPVVDGAALRALGPDGGGVLGHLGRDHTSAELQDLLVSQTRTLQDRNESFTPVLIFKKICLCYSDLWIIEQVSGDMKHTDGVTHTGTRGSFGSGSAFDAQVTEWTALSSGTWEAGRSHRTGTAGTTDCTFGSTL